MKTFLCHSQELPEDGEKGFAQSDQEQQTVLLLRREGHVYAYQNNCPHTGVALNWQPDQFLDADKFYIQCSVHGAKFEVETGLCVWGPCANQSLTALNVMEEDGRIFLLKQS